MSNSFENIQKRTLDRIDNNLSKIEGSFTHNTVGACSYEISKAYMNMEDILKIGFIQDTFYDYLDARVSEFGIYRKHGTKSVGKLIATGDDDVYIANGTLLACNGLQYVVLNDIVLPTEDRVVIEAVEIGYKYNQTNGNIFTPLEEIHGLKSLVLDGDLIGGSDIETDEELLARFQKSVENPPTSGNIYHYEQWALECEGIGRAKVYPLWNGNGTVKVMVTGNNNKPVDETLLDRCREHIANKMPIGCQLTVTTPTLLNVTITARVNIVEGFTVEEIKDEFNLELEDYLKSLDNEFVYSKVYGILAKLPGVDDLIELKINDGTSNIQIREDRIINISSVDISEVM